MQQHAIQTTINKREKAKQTVSQWCWAKGNARSAPPQQKDDAQQYNDHLLLTHTNNTAIGRLNAPTKTTNNKEDTSKGTITSQHPLKKRGTTSKNTWRRRRRPTIAPTQQIKTPKHNQQSTKACGKQQKEKSELESSRSTKQQ
jgi:hypothetical protein